MKRVGEQCLRGLSLTLELPTGEQAVFDVDTEMHIPAGLDELVEAAQTAPARAVFWSEQYRILKRQVERVAAEVARVEGERSLQYRRYFRREPDAATEGKINAALNMDTDVAEKREELRAITADLDLIGIIRDGVVHRVYMVRQLLASRARADQG